jgi:hypothetical protein
VEIMGSYAFYSCSNISQINLNNFSSQPSWNAMSVFTGISASGTVSVTGGWQPQTLDFLYNLGLPSGEGTNWQLAS